MGTVLWVFTTCHLSFFSSSFFLLLFLAAAALPQTSVILKEAVNLNVRVTNQSSLRGHAFEPVLEIEDSTINAVSVVAGVAEFLILLLRVLLGPG